ncbi:class II fumarate hydratase [Candidatus Marinarcus aquaticus]|uniref:Fumarate hydratase class II n=1 Tax=Candidatus Marinarcus aquaticus TaxID=2044504 RepID=A0A4V1LPD6_9BACT|nr:class II fumarate hydratase [Candidatus Marinarcus aquaticus]RXJ60828.1 fumarate hydratase, class II [Candidatus Marinarcus aquaticus]
MQYRMEHDTMGEVQVENSKLWAAQTQRSLENFKIGIEKMPKELIHAFAHLKSACAKANCDLGKLSNEKAIAIQKACEDILKGKYPHEFPLSVWQTGSGTQSNMNLNEVISSIATVYLGEDFRVNRLIHPNDDVNMSQSSNDTFPTAMRIAFLLQVQNELLPSIDKLHDTLQSKSKTFESVVKIGRTHLQDATPLSLGQEFSGYVEMLKKSKEQILDALKYIKELAIGGTAVGTGINCHCEFSNRVCAVLNDATKTGIPFVSHPNKFHGLTSHDAEVFLSGALNGLAANAMKIANDIRWLSSGPRCGIGELTIPANEPGSSIMPGKVNPTQSEALTMVAVQVMGNHATIGIAASQGNFELNVFKPVIAYNLIQSIQLLADAIRSFNEHCAVGIEANETKINEYLNDSLMLVTALNPYIGYEKAALIAKEAYKNCTTLKEEAQKLGILSSEDFDKFVQPLNMIYPEK